MNVERDPATMSDHERLHELGSLFAAGFRRLSLSRKKELDVSAENEPSCVRVGNGQSHGIAKEAV